MKGHAGSDGRVQEILRGLEFGDWVGIRSGPPDGSAVQGKTSQTIGHLKASPADFRTFYQEEGLS